MREIPQNLRPNHNFCNFLKQNLPWKRKINRKLVSSLTSQKQLKKFKTVDAAAANQRNKIRFFTARLIQILFYFFGCPAALTEGRSTNCNTSKLSFTNTHIRKDNEATLAFQVVERANVELSVSGNATDYLLFFETKRLVSVMREQQARIWSVAFSFSMPHTCLRTQSTAFNPCNASFRSYHKHLRHCLLKQIFNK